MAGANIWFEAAKLMHVLFVIRSADYTRFFEAVLRELCADGHQVEVLCQLDKQADTAPDAPQAWLQRRAEQYGFKLGIALRRSDRWRRSLFASRRLINYAAYLRPGRQSSQMVIRQYENALPAALRQRARLPIVQAALKTSAVYRALRWYERLVPPDPAIAGWLQRHRPDVVVASPVIIPRTDEVEYLKAAADLGIATVLPVTSWDNLTSYGVIPVVPDMTLVWNERQVDEAVRLHHVPPNRVMFTGAAVFDDWFGLRPTLDRAAFCRLAGLDPDRPYLLYLCSARSIAQNETIYVEEVVRGLRDNPATQRLSVLVRPHPWNARIWDGAAGGGYTVWPRERTITTTPDVRQAMFHSIYYSAGVAGINTSAHIEAAIVDRPCLTILAERYQDTQQNFTHFNHLLNGRFLEVARDIAEAAEILASLLQGHDARREQRRRFVHDFVRPWGLETPASRITAVAIQAVGQRRNFEQLHAILAEAGDGPGALAPSPALAGQA
jgi:hypothetical protein